MDKVKLDFEVPEIKTIEYKGKSFELTPFITVPQQVVLINSYLRDYLSDVEEKFVPSLRYNYMEAELNLVARMVQILTNVEVEEMDGNIYADPSFTDVLFHEIINYDNFKKHLDDIIKEAKYAIELENSIGTVLSNLVEKAYETLNNFSDITPEEIEKLQKTGNELAEKLEASSIIKDVAKQPQE